MDWIKKVSTGIGSLLFACASLSAQQTAVAADPAVPQIAIIVDDIGYNRASGERALALPAPLTFAIIPFTPYGIQLAHQAHQLKQEVMVHVPMQSSDPNRVNETGIISKGLSELETRERIDQALNAIPFKVGFNNHMGSNVTDNPRIMHWVMQQAQTHPVYFIDSRTTPQTVAQSSAQLYGIPTLKRDVFLDNQQTEAAITAQFQKLVALAKRQGYAIGIGHPYPATLQFLEKTLNNLDQYSVQLAHVSELVAQYGQSRLHANKNNSTNYLQWLVSLPPPLSHRLDFSSFIRAPND